MNWFGREGLFSQQLELLNNRVSPSLQINCLSDYLVFSTAGATLRNNFLNADG